MPLILSFPTNSYTFVTRVQIQKEVISDLRGENQFFFKRDMAVYMVNL